MTGIRSFAAAMLVLSICTGLCTTTAAAQTYPSKPIKVIVPYTPGSPNDVMVRLLAQQLQGKLG